MGSLFLRSCPSPLPAFLPAAQVSLQAPAVVSVQPAVRAGAQQPSHSQLPLSGLGLPLPLLVPWKEGGSGRRDCGGGWGVAVWGEVGSRAGGKLMCPSPSLPHRIKTVSLRCPCKAAWLAQDWGEQAAPEGLVLGSHSSGEPCCLTGWPAGGGQGFVGT